MKISAYLVSHHSLACPSEGAPGTPSGTGTPVGTAAHLGPAGVEALLNSHGFTVEDSIGFSGPGYAGTRRALSRTTVAAPPAQTTDLLRALAGDDARHCLVPADLIEAERKLLVMDVDSTLIQQEVIELLAAHAGRGADVAAVTEAAMRGELDFAESLHARVATLAGLDAAVIDQVRDAVLLSAGARELIAACHTGGHLVGVVSGGFQQILDPLSDELGLDFALANKLGISGGRLTGTVEGQVVDASTKETSLRRWAAKAGIPLEHTIAAGDGANDLLMVRAAGLGIAYCAKPALRAAADAVIDVPRLDLVGHLAGVCS